jgi:hypothetical protein
MYWVAIEGYASCTYLYWVARTEGRPPCLNRGLDKQHLSILLLGSYRGLGKLHLPILGSQNRRQTPCRSSCQGETAN